MKLPCIITDTVQYILLKDYQDFPGYIVLIISTTGVFTKADKRIKGDIKQAIETFQKLYEYNGKVEYKYLYEIIS